MDRSITKAGKLRVIGYNTYFISFWREFGEVKRRFTVTPDPLDPLEYNELESFIVTTSLTRQDFFDPKIMPGGINRVLSFAQRVGEPVSHADPATKAV